MLDIQYRSGISRKDKLTRAADALKRVGIPDAREQLSRKPYPLPRMKLNPAVTDIFAFQYEDFTLENYQAHPSIKAAIAV